MVSLATYGVLSVFLLSWALLSAFRLRANFFSAAVYLSKSNACMLIMWNFGVFCTVVFGKLVQKVFFGQLRMIEVERLNERAWFAITETLLALTIFREEFDTSFVALFISLLFVKVFHWLASDRVEFMEQTPSVSIKFHIRMVVCLCLLYAVDLLLLAFAAESILLEGPSVMIMFASEYLILLATVWTLSARYGVNVYDARHENWDGKSLWVFYIELIADFGKLLVYVAFFSLILTFYGLPLNTLRDLYMTARSFILKCRDLMRYKAATRNMDERYPNATNEEMDRLSDRTCIICREDMGIPSPMPNDSPVHNANSRPVARGGPNETPKKLPCGHVFHFHCLRSWLERQQSCPTWCVKRQWLDEHISELCSRHSVLQPGPNRNTPATPARPGIVQQHFAPHADAQQGMRPALFNVIARGLPPVQPRAPTPAAVGTTPHIHPQPLGRSGQLPPAVRMHASASNPLVKYRTPLPAGSAGPHITPWSPAAGFAEALRQYLSPMGANLSAGNRNTVSQAMTPSRSSPIVPTLSTTLPGVSHIDPSRLGSMKQLLPDEQSACMHRDRAAADSAAAAASARTLPKLSSSDPLSNPQGTRARCTPSHASEFRRTASDGGPAPTSNVDIPKVSNDFSFVPSLAATDGIGMMPIAIQKTPSRLVATSQLPRIIPLFDVAGVHPSNLHDWSATSYRDSRKSADSMVIDNSLHQLAPSQTSALLDARAAIDRCRHQIETVLQQTVTTRTDESNELDLRIESLQLARDARQRGDMLGYQAAMDAFDALHIPQMDSDLQH